MKRLILLLYLVFATISPSLAIVSVSTETARFATEIDSVKGIQSIELSQDDTLIVFGCGPHQWVKALALGRSGMIFMGDVDFVYGRLPTCQYVPKNVPPSDTPDAIQEPMKRA